MRRTTLALALALVFGACSAPEPAPVYVLTASSATTASESVTDIADPSGFLLGSPAGFTAGNGDPQIRIKDAGFESIWTGGTAIEKFLEFVAQHFPDSPDGESPLLAMSLGIDVFHVEEGFELDPTKDILDGVEPKAGEYALLDIGAHGWVALQFSVDSAPLAEDPVPILSLAPDVFEAWDKAELDRTVFSFLHPQSDAVIVPEEVESVRAMDPHALGLGEGDAIHALNMHMALYGTDLGDFDGFTEADLPEEPTVYFTIRPGFLNEETIAQLEDTWRLSPDAQTIYQSTWDGDRSAWGRVSVFATAADMGLTGRDSEPALVVDGLAMSVLPGAAPLVIFSLVSDEPHDQIRFVNLKDRPGVPRRVIVRETPGNYRSLGSRLRAGRGIGDFCIKDPEGRPQRESDYIVDDFFVARRLKPVLNCPLHGGDTSATAVLPVIHRQRFVDLRVTRISDLLRSGRVPFPDPQRDLRDLMVVSPPSTIFRIPIDWTPWLPPVSCVCDESNIRLAVSGYRHHPARDDEPAYLRTCMSWPRPLASTGTAHLAWGHMDRYLDSAGAVIEWEETRSFVYSGEPLVADVRVPAITHPDKGRSVVAQWTLEAAGNVWVAPLCALRY